MDKPITSGLRFVFLVHMLVGLVFGLGYLIVPAMMTEWFNMPLTDEPYLRLVGAAILGYSATSMAGYRARKWAEVKIVVEGEFVWTGLAATLSLWLLLDGTWPTIGWLLFGLMALFFVAFGYYFWREERTLTVPGPAMSKR
jgi:hypothetical protein